MRTEIYKEHYEFEWDHRAHLMSAAGIPVAVATLVGGGLVTMLESVRTFSGATGLIFSVASAATGVCLATAVVYVFRSQYGYTYKRLPTPLKLRQHYDELARWHSRKESPTGALEKDFEEELNRRLGEAVEVNAANNIKKSACIHRANLFVALSLVSVLIAAISYTVQKRGEDAPIHRVLLVPPQP